jgi:hypothetical protein
MLCCDAEAHARVPLVVCGGAPEGNICHLGG